MKVLSLFSGVGGFDMGLEAAGMETVFQCEWDKHANQILNRHWPHVPKWEDVSTLTGKHILQHAPAVDVVAWGSPCQDLSVAGKRAGLDGERSGLFHEGIRIIKELRKETNNVYPRISIWENVAGALSSNRGADFGVILDEMAEAGAMVIEWAMLDAQHFGIPQRRRRIFLIAIFDPTIATNCPSPLLPVSPSLRGDTTKGKPKGKSAAGTLTEGVGTGSGIVNAICGETYHHGGITNQDVGSGHMVVESAEWWNGGQVADALTTTSDSQRMPDKNKLQMVIETSGYTSSSFAQYTEGIGTLRSNGGDLGGGSETMIVEPFVKSRRAQSATDDETWVEGEVNPTLNSFDVGDTRATTAIVEQPMLFDGRRVDDVRVYEPPVQTLGARMGTGGNNVPMLAFDTQFGSNANVFEDQSPTLKASQQSPSVAYPIDTRNALRDPEKHDAQNRQGLGIGKDGDPSSTVTSAFIPAVAYDEYNDSTSDVHHALRAGTKQSTGVLEPSMAVRRLTPLECERLMGWPDDHTRFKADGTEQADTHRYKQCGNGVASPVAEWIGKHLMKLVK